VEALTARSQGQFAVTVVSEEAHLPYDRVALSKALLDVSADLTLSQDVWGMPGVTLKLGSGASAIDTESQTVTLANGETLNYDELVVATGSNAATLSIPGSEHTHLYRYMEDVHAINSEIAALATALGRQVRVVAIGGGLLGLEAAAGARDLGAYPIVVDGGQWLMGRQLDQGAGQALGRLIAEQGIEVCGGSFPSAITLDDSGTRVTGVELANGTSVDADLVIVSIGVRPRDELFRQANESVRERGGADPFALGERGGVIIDETCATSAPRVWAIGEVANFSGMCIGLVAPANTMAEIAADRLCGGSATFPGFDTATKLKLSGVEVASFGDAFAEAEGSMEIVYADPARGLYQKIVVSQDAKTLLGGIFVGDATPYTSLRPLLGRELTADPGAYLSASNQDAPSGDLPDDAILCSCNNVSVGSIKEAVHGCGTCEGKDPVTELGPLKTCTKAGTQCGSCIPMLKKLLESELAKSGVTVSRALCEHFEMSRADLFEAVRIAGLTTFDQVLTRFGTGIGCDICKPTIASILATQHDQYLLDPGLGGLQDTNDRALANMQKDGTYSVVPRIPGGEITPAKLAVIAHVAQRYGLYTKITGGLRIDLFGARLEQLPDIWKELVDAGFESGHAYGKALRNVKSCVGSTWCRYGVQDSVAMGIQLELRYRGLRSPHKLKMGVSGCARECAEARAKDVGVIASTDGWNLYVGGNGGANPAHGQLLAQGLDDETLITYIDRFLMYYIRTADRLQRTAAWLADLEGGMQRVKEVVIDDCLTLAQEFEADVAKHVENYEDEWAATLKDPERLRRFRSFVNAPQTPDNTLQYEQERGQRRPVMPPVNVGATIAIRPATVGDDREV
jgi:nitrite reductase (NADH) large subunit